jgi:hypothetical protein
LAEIPTMKPAIGRIQQDLGSARSAFGTTGRVGQAGRSFATGSRAISMSRGLARLDRASIGRATGRIVVRPGVAFPYRDRGEATQLRNLDAIGGAAGSWLACGCFSSERSIRRRSCSPGRWSSSVGRMGARASRDRKGRRASVPAGTGSPACCATLLTTSPDPLQAGCVRPRASRVHPCSRAAALARRPPRRGHSLPRARPCSASTRRQAVRIRERRERAGSARAVCPHRQIRTGARPRPANVAGRGWRRPGGPCTRA